MHARSTSPPGPTLAPDLLQPLGQGLHRPESVLVNAAGEVWCAHWGADGAGGVAHLRIDAPLPSAQTLVGQRADGHPLRPNGIARQADGSFLLAQLGDGDGGIWRLAADGAATPWLLEVDGQVLPPTNFVALGNGGAAWITVSTRRQPRALGYRADVADGFIVRCDAADPRRASRAQIVAEGLGYTNEVAEHGGFLYVVETFGRRLSRLPIGADGSLGAREVVTTFGAGTFPDGLAFDEEGNAWIASIVSNRLIRVAPDGSQTVWLEDADAAHVARVEAAFQAGTMGRGHLDRPAGRRLANISSIAFVPGQHEALLGSLQGDGLWRVPMPAAGAPLPHWRFEAMNR